MGGDTGIRAVATHGSMGTMGACMAFAGHTTKKTARVASTATTGGACNFVLSITGTSSLLVVEYLACKFQGMAIVAGIGFVIWTIFCVIVLYKTYQAGGPKAVYNQFRHGKPEGQTEKGLEENAFSNEKVAPLLA